MALGTQMQQRRATAADWATSNYILAAGELGVTTDTGILKIGDGVNGWNDLDIAFAQEYLPLLGTAANSELIGGISADSFRTAEESPTYAEMTAAISTSHKTSISRTITSGSFTLAVADQEKIVWCNGSGYSPIITANIPINTSVAIEVGTTITIAAVGQKAVQLVPAGGVTLVGLTMVYGGGSVARLTKIDTDSWMVESIYQSPPPAVRRLINNSSYPIPASADTIVSLAGSDTSSPAQSKNFDSLGSDQQWSSGVDNRLTSRRAGYYDVLAKFSLSNIASTKRMFIELDINGTTQYLGGMGATVTSTSGVQQQFSVALDLGDYVRMVVRHDDTVSRNISHGPMGASYIQWRWARPL